MDEGGNKNSQSINVPFPCDFSTARNKNIFYSRISTNGTFYKQLKIVGCGH